MTTHELKFNQQLVLLNAEVARLDGRARHASTWKELKHAENAIEVIRSTIQAVYADAVYHDIDLMKYQVVIMDIATRLGSIEGQLVELRQTLEEGLWYRAIRVIRDAASLFGALVRRGLEFIERSPLGKYLPSREEIRKFLPSPRNS